MLDTVVVLIKSDPLKSHRPVEGIRIALGLASGEHPVAIILMNEAPSLLSDETEDLVDGDLLQNYLPVLKEIGQTFFIEENAFSKAGLDPMDHRIEAVSYDRISELIQKADRFIIL